MSIHLKPGVKFHVWAAPTLHPIWGIVLPIIDRVFAESGHSPCTITSAFDGTHQPGSLHYVGRALDFRRWDIETSATLVCADLRKELGPDFDVVLESDHIHVEFDPK